MRKAAGVLLLLVSLCLGRSVANAPAHTKIAVDSDGPQPITLLKGMTCDLNEPAPIATPTGSMKDLISAGDRALVTQSCRAAIADYNAAAALDPKDYLPLWRAAFAIDALALAGGNYALFYDATHDLDKIVEVKPRAAGVYILRGVSTQFAAVGIYDRANLVSMFSVKHRAMNMERQAIDDFNKAIALDPQAGEAYTGIYVSCRVLGDKDCMARSYLKAKELDAKGLQDYEDGQAQLAEKRKAQSQAMQSAMRSMAVSAFHAALQEQINEWKREDALEAACEHKGGIYEGGNECLIPRP